MCVMRCPELGISLVKIEAGAKAGASGGDNEAVSDGSKD
jgi:hypothetical protein